MVNASRNCSFYFGRKAITKFLKDNDLIAVIRAHEAQAEGFKFHDWIPESPPSVMTIFSAPNYCDMYGNKAAIIILEQGNMTVQQFFCSPHPFVLPNFMDILEWSLPFVTEKSKPG